MRCYHLRLYALPIMLSLSFPLAFLGCKTPEKEYIESDRLTYLAVAPEYIACLDKHGASDWDKQRGLRTIDTWAFRLRKVGVDVEGFGPLYVTPTARTAR